VAGEAAGADLPVMAAFGVAVTLGMGAVPGMAAAERGASCGSTMQPQTRAARAALTRIE